MGGIAFAQESNPEMGVREDARLLNAPLATMNIFVVPLRKIRRQSSDLADKGSQSGQRPDRYVFRRRDNRITRQCDLDASPIRNVHGQFDRIVLDDDGDAHDPAE